jgi:hypothetical protein
MLESVLPGERQGTGKMSWHQFSGAVQVSNPARGTPDCRMIERNVPVLTSL